jgi:pantoate--beta-alanine ligase
LLLNSLAPLLIVVLGALLYRQRLEWNQGLGLLFSSIGVVILVLQGRWSRWHAISFVPGDAIMLGAAILWTVYTL